VPQQNIAFVRGFLESGGIPIVAEDLGGGTARHVHFHTSTGRVFVKRAATERAPRDGAVSLA
jgi:chemotaxis protein CheD